MAVAYLSTACLTSSRLAVSCSDMVSTSFSVVVICFRVLLLKKIRAMMHRRPVRNRSTLIMLGFFIFGVSFLEILKSVALVVIIMKGEGKCNCE